MLDGEDMLNWWQRNAGGDVTGTTLGIDAIAEFQTLTGTYSAQYAGNGGAIVGVTKSGTNEFHGSAYEFFRNSDLDSPRLFRRRFRASRSAETSIGGTLGGPIKKNKVFFFMNYEGIQQVLDTTYCQLRADCTDMSRTTAAPRAWSIRLRPRCWPFTRLPTEDCSMATPTSASITL